MSTTHLPLTVRRLGHEGMEPMLRAIVGAFGEDASPEMITGWQRILERDRTFELVDGDAVVGGGSIYSFGVSIPGGTDLPAAGLTAVGLLPSHRRRGGLRSLIGAVFADGIARHEPISVLWASEGPIYGRFGYGMATMRGTMVASRDRIRFTPPVAEVGRIRLLTAADALTALPPVWRAVAARTPGFFSRSREWWRDEVLDDAEWRRAGAGPRFIPAIEVDGEIRGYAFYRMRAEWDHLGARNVLEVREVMAADPAIELALWRFLASQDLVATIKAQNVDVDGPLFHRVDDPRRLALTIGDGMWLRILDLPAALEARAWATDDDLVVEVQDALVPANQGTWRLTVRDGRATVTRANAPADVSLGIAELGAMYLGGVRAAQLSRAGRITAADPASIRRLDALHAVERRPWCPAGF